LAAGVALSRQQSAFSKTIAADFRLWPQIKKKIAANFANEHESETKIDSRISRGFAAGFL
jgi:hypothetical protein